jgi:prevent-host-death family protein
MREVVVKTITMLDFRRRAGRIVKQIRQGESMVLSYRGEESVVLTPYRKGPPEERDPLFDLPKKAEKGGSLTNDDIDGVLYG